MSGDMTDLKTISLAPRLIHPARPGHTVFSYFFAIGFFSSCSGRVRAWVSVLGVLHQKKGEFDEGSGVHLDSGQKLGELMLARSDHVDTPRFAAGPSFHMPFW